MQNEQTPNDSQLPVLIGDNPEVVATLLKKFENRMRSVARRVVPDLADDCVSEANTIALEKIQTFRGTTMSELGGWLRTITLNVALSHYRKQKKNKEREQALIDLHPKSDTRTASQALRLEEEGKRVIQMLDQLMDEEREAVWLRHVENWSIAEIATHMNRTESAVGGVLFRAMKKLRTDINVSEWSQLLG
ncbi:MAG: sigma-70 family RNA polymerase sigma factor [Planctomycetota bacterium]